MNTRQDELWVIETMLYWKYEKLTGLSQKDKVIKKVLKEIRKDKDVKEAIQIFKENVQYDLDIICADLIRNANFLEQIGIGKVEVFELLEDPKAVNRVIKEFFDTDITINIFIYCIQSYILALNKTFLEVIEEEFKMDLFEKIQEGIINNKRDIYELYDLIKTFIIVQLSKGVEELININVKVALEGKWLRTVCKNQELPDGVKKIFESYSESEKDEIIQKALVIALAYLPDNPDKTFKENFFEALRNSIIIQQH